MEADTVFNKVYLYFIEYGMEANTVLIVYFYYIEADMIFIGADMEDHIVLVECDIAPCNLIWL